MSGPQAGEWWVVELAPDWRMVCHCVVFQGELAWERLDDILPTPMLGMKPIRKVELWP